MAQREFEVFHGFINFDSDRVVVDFEAPLGATTQEKDSIFLAALAQKVELSYLAIGQYSKDASNESTNGTQHH